MVRRLIYSSLFPADRCVLFVAKYLKIKLDYKEIEPVKCIQIKHLKDDYFNHPTPTLEYDDTRIQSSAAMAGYLISLHDKEGSLYPTDVKKRAKIGELLHYNNAVLLPKAYQAITTLLTGQTASLSRAMKYEIDRIYNSLEEFLTKPWIADENMCLADLSCIPSITTIELISNVDKSKYPKLHQYLQKCLTIPQYKEANQDGLDRLTKHILEKIEKVNNRL